MFWFPPFFSPLPPHKKEEIREGLKGNFPYFPRKSPPLSFFSPLNLTPPFSPTLEKDINVEKVYHQTCAHIPKNKRLFFVTHAHPANEQGFAVNPPAECKRQSIFCRQTLYCIWWGVGLGWGGNPRCFSTLPCS